MTKTEARTLLAAILARTPAHQPVCITHNLAAALAEAESREGESVDGAD